MNAPIHFAETDSGPRGPKRFQLTEPKIPRGTRVTLASDPTRRGEVRVAAADGMLLTLWADYTCSIHHPSELEAQP
ncbi:hypothetical protein [Gloeobacter violaceus]|uniref:Gsr3889 protein n=1 Tax=Gloeobacter violaceus (strain ATCC 29082 / PCC 7421) TaxID=251221 RepID=Q7NEJ0_GLOVI|nr:hypothetical protein [Gloeobacter violaceus]BAC91830.1 gsr3889 [Gloeobacter violaceus PCC 7421]